MILTGLPLMVVEQMLSYTYIRFRIQIDANLTWI